MSEQDWKTEWQYGWKDGLSYGLNNYEILEDKGYKYGISRETPKWIYNKPDDYRCGFFEGMHTANSRLSKKHKVLSCEEILNQCGKRSIIIGKTRISKIGTKLPPLDEELNRITNKQNWLTINKNNKVVKFFTNIFSRKK